MKHLPVILAVAFGVFFFTACDNDNHETSPLVHDEGDYVPLATGNEWYFLRYDWVTQDTDTVKVSIYDTSYIGTALTYDWIIDYPDGSFEHYRVEPSVDSLTFLPFIGGTYYEFRYPLEEGNSWHANAGFFSVMGVDTVEIGDEWHIAYEVQFQLDPTPQAVPMIEHLWLVRGIGFIRIRKRYADPFGPGYLADDSMAIISWNLH